MLPQDLPPRLREGARTRITVAAILLVVATACTDQAIPTGTAAPPAPRAFPRTPGATVIDVDRRAGGIGVSVAEPAHACVVETDYSVICWGYGYNYPFSRFAGPYTRVATGSVADCAIRKNDGTIDCFRGNLTSRAGKFRDLSIGFIHACAIRADDDTVFCWQDFTLPGHEYGQATPPEGKFLMVDAGLDHTCGIRFDNAHVCWGNPAASDIDPDDPSVPSWPGTFYRVSAGDSHTCAINTNFSLRCGGNDAYGKVSDPSLGPNALEVSAGSFHTCAINTSHDIYCWGLNTEGQANPPPGDYIFVEAGPNFTCAITEQFIVRCWGSKSFEILNLPYELGDDLATATSIEMSPRPSTFGAEVTMTATVTVPSRVAATNFPETPSTGRVMFIDGGTCASPTTVLAQGVAIANGTASFSTTALGVGSHAIAACYLGGDGLKASGIGAILEVKAAPTTTAITLSPSSQQYSDKVTLEASITPASVNGTAVAGVVQFTIDGGLVGAGPVVVGANGKATLPNVQMTYTPGAHSVGAQFTPTDQTLFQSSTATTASLTVTKEDASIVYSADNTTAMKVTTSGGPLAANALSLQLGVRETEPDAAGTGTAGIGSNIPGVTVAVSLLPIGPGSVATLTCSATGVTGSGYTTTRNFTCKNPAALPVNVYAVQATLTSTYYQATQYEDVVTVYDPVAGFVTGGGTFRIDGDLVRFGINLKYKTNGKNTTATQGSVFAVRHHANGRKSRFESNSLSSAVAIGEDLTVPMGWAVVSGKSTYTAWDAATSSDVTLGGQAFTVYVEDRGDPGAGVDRVWMGGPGVLTLPGTLSAAKTSAVLLTGGNVAVPHRSP